MFSANCTLRADFADFAVSSHQINGHRAPFCGHVAPFYSSSSVQCPDLSVQTQHTIIFAYELYRIHAKRLQACLPPCAFLFVFRARECAIIEVTYVSRWCACVPKHAHRVRNIMLTHVPAAGGPQQSAEARACDTSTLVRHTTTHCTARMYVAEQRRRSRQRAGGSTHWRKISACFIIRFGCLSASKSVVPLCVYFGCAIVSGVFVDFSQNVQRK